MSNDIIPKNEKFLPPAAAELNTDFKYSRDNLYNLIETAMAGIAEFAPVAAQSQNARCYEVLFNAIKCTAELNEKLADHGIKKEESTAPEKPVGNTGDTTHQHLHLTTADLANMVEKAIKKTK